MDYQTVVTDVKTLAEKYVAQGQEVATISFDTLKAANGIVVEAAQTVAKTGAEAATALIGDAKANFEKATAAGVKAVAANPVAYLPSKTPAVEAFNSTVKTLNVTRGELVKTFESGFGSIKSTLTGTPAAVETVKATAKKVTKTAAAKAKKVAA